MFLSQIEKRRSIRKYLKKPVEPQKIEKITESMLRAPSSRGFMPWEFVIVDDREILEKLSKTRVYGSSFIKNAAAAIVFFADSNTADTWVEDCTISAIYAQLSAESMGLGSCWIQVRAREHSDTVMAEQYIAKLLGIPESFSVECMMAFGYPDEQPKARSKDSLHFEKVKYNSYHRLYFNQ